MASLPLHLRVVALSILPLIALIVAEQWMQNNAAEHLPTIAIEHEKAATVVLRLSMRGRVRLLDIASHTTEPLLVSVPQDWRRGEVRGVPLGAVTTEAPSFGFTRWTLPPRARVTFHTDGSWRSMTIENPSRVPLELRFTHVDLETERAVHDVVLVTDEKVTMP